MDPLISLALATFAFVGTHLALSHPLRAPLVARLGDTGFMGLYSVVALATLGWMILAYRAVTPTVPLWAAPAWGPWASSGVMLVALILLAGSLIRNPALPHPGAQARDIPPPRGVFAITRHPMNWSFILWALTHIALIGSPRNLIVAQGILLLALVGSLGQDAKKARLVGQSWRDWQARTSFVPFAALLAGRVRWRDAIPGPVALIGGLLLWTLITWQHAPMWSPLVLIGYYG
jgi:uncharacterized membrane protein